MKLLTQHFFFPSPSSIFPLLLLHHTHKSHGLAFVFCAFILFFNENYKICDQYFRFLIIYTRIIPPKFPIFQKKSYSSSSREEKDGTSSHTHTPKKKKKNGSVRKKRVMMRIIYIKYQRTAPKMSWRCEWDHGGMKKKKERENITRGWFSLERERIRRRRFEFGNFCATVCKQRNAKHRFQKNFKK